MSKNGWNRHKGKGTGGPGARGSAPQSLSAVRAGRAVDALTPAFVRWFEEVSPGSAVAALECLEPIKAVLGRYMDTTAAADVTSLEPAGLSVAVSDEISAALDDAGPASAPAGATVGDARDVESSTYVVHSVGAFVEFLVETGRWSGSADQLAAVMDFLDVTGVDDGGGGLMDERDIPAPAPSPAPVPSPAPALSVARESPRPSATPILQLKITLNDSKPPIWRRVLVPAGTLLPQLHQVIQALFGWLDDHLHEFRVGGVRGTAYAPVNPDGGDGSRGGPSRDESTATAGELLPAEGSSLSYTYDFGDNWVLAVKVEKILPDDDGGQLPRCTAGRGRAPAEDSGGTWGWANIVQAVNDPHHEDHKEYREWLGMLPGDTLDPKSFDLDEINEDLADITF